MEKNLKKLYNYCKSQGYEGSPEEFQQELEELRAKELNNKDLSDVSGGRKSATAFAASLVSALSIASPFASAAQTMQSDNHTVMSTLNKYKSSIANKLEKGINQVKKNEKTLKNILLKGVLPIGVPITLVGAGILIKNKIEDNSPDGKTHRFLVQLLAQSFDECANYCATVSPKEKINIDRRILSSAGTHHSCDEFIMDNYRGKITCLKNACDLCSAITGDSSASGFTTNPSNYNELKQFVNSKNIKKSNGNFVINDDVKTHFSCFSKIIDKQKIVAPWLIWSSYLRGNDELVNKITNNQYVQESMKKLETAINNLKQEAEALKSVKPSDSINTPNPSQSPVNVPDDSGVPIPPPVVQIHPSQEQPSAGTNSYTAEQRDVENEIDIPNGTTAPTAQPSPEPQVKLVETSQTGSKNEADQTSEKKEQQPEKAVQAPITPVVQPQPAPMADTPSASLEGQIENLTSTIEQRNRKLLNSTTRHPEKLRMKMYRQEKELTSLQKQKAKKSETQKDPQEIAEELSGKITELEAQIEKAKLDYEKVQSAQKENEKKLSDGQKERDGLVEHIKRTQQQLDRSQDKKRKKELERKIDNLKTKVNALEPRLENLKQQAKEAQRDVQSKLQTLKKLNKQLTEIKAQLNQLRSGSST